MIDEVADLDHTQSVAPQFLGVVNVVDDRRQPMSDARRGVVLSAVNQQQVRVV